ncbi:protein NinF [Escherichia coli]|uniref:protein NinF n=1 Tax=Escherichia coli TaxID=562 RepID=UPI001C55AC3A|nr:protein NinF [Escherichia coli]MBW1555051.1 hypothetical protein [Escherichia coli]
MIDPNRSYEQESVERALTCANCGQKLHVLEVHVCSDYCKYQCNRVAGCQTNHG